MSDVPPQSALVVEVPEAEAAVRGHRYALDANARRGIPAHFTVLFPFMPPARIDSTALAKLQQLFAGTAAFDFQLTHTAWFGEDVLWLGPANPQPFRALTELVFRAFPDFPPFDGQYPDVVPHLTIAHGSDLADMHVAERAVDQHLPIQGCAQTVTLMTQTRGNGAWSRKTTIPLAQP
jgi:2'-5' RNA ligase